MYQHADYLAVLDYPSERRVQDFHCVSEAAKYRKPLTRYVHDVTSRRLTRRRSSLTNERYNSSGGSRWIFWCHCLGDRYFCSPTTLAEQARTISARAS